jgi:Xaa-Pro aminopeptidase
MKESVKEAVGPKFRIDSLRVAQDRAWKSLKETADRLKPGDSEKDAARILKEVLKENGVEKIWHPPQIRFGENTTLPFGKTGKKDIVLQKDDLFFLDIGPVFEGHEGDVGDTFVLGNNPSHQKIASDAKLVFEETKQEWQRSGKSGEELYDFAQASAQAKGWVLSLSGASGHRVSDFPHAIHYRGKLKTLDATPSSDRWILEIHILDPAKRFGAFFEDLL